MSRPRSAGSIFWGLILIVAGSVFLLKNLGYDVPLWTGIAKYWPVLLIVWGFIKLIDYARWKRAGETRPLFGAGEVVLLIVVIMSGTALTAAANMSPDLAHLFEIAEIDIWEVTGNSYHFTEHYEQDVTGMRSIEIINRYGSVEVIPSDTSRIVVDVEKTVIAKDQGSADELSRSFHYSIVEEDQRYRVISNFNRDENRIRGRRFKTSLRVTVPKRSAIILDNRNGSVEVSGLTGDQRITNGFGRVTVRAINGALYVANRNDNVVVEDITGATMIHNEFASIETRRVTGALEIRNRNGSVELYEITGDTKIQNAFGPVQVAGIKGSLDVGSRNGSVEVENVENDVNVENQFETVQLNNIKGSVTVTNRNGSVDIRYDEPPRRNIQVNSQFADVSLVMPASSAFSIDARTRYADIETDFSQLNAREERERRTLTGQVGTGGPEIRIDTRNGNIRVAN
jgi:hypothetical protein